MLSAAILTDRTTGVPPYADGGSSRQQSAQDVAGNLQLRTANAAAELVDRRVEAAAQALLKKQQLEMAAKEAQAAVAAAEMEVQVTKQKSAAAVKAELDAQLDAQRLAHREQAEALMKIRMGRQQAVADAEWKSRVDRAAKGAAAEVAIKLQHQVRMGSHMYRATSPCKGKGVRNKHVKRLRVLLVDGHVGPLSEARSYLQRYLNASVDVIPFYAYRHLSTPQRSVLSNETFAHLSNYFGRCGFPNFFPCKSRLVYQAETSFQQLNDDLQQAAFLSTSATSHPLEPTVAREIEARIDVVLCQFPGFQCATFEPLAVGIAVRFTHRFDHHVNDKQKVPWINMMQRWAASGRAAFFADNEFDSHYLWHFSRINAMLWPATGAAFTGTHAEAPGTPSYCFCCASDPLAEGSPSGPRALLTRLRRVAADHNPSLRIHTMREARVHAHAPNLALSTNCTAMVLIPHSLHAYTTVEAYTSGFPMIAPSAKLLASWQAKYAVVQHYKAGNHPLTIRGSPDRDDDLKRTSPLTADVGQLASWLTKCEFYGWPGVQLFDEDAELPALLEASELPPRMEQSEYMEAAAHESAPRVKSALQRLQRKCKTVDAAPHSTIHRMRKSRLLRLGQKNV